MDQRTSHGQTSTSYLGAIVVSVGVVLSILALGVPSVIGDGLSRAICAIAGRPGCETGVGPEVTLSPVEVATSGRLVVLGDSFTSGDGAYDYEKGTDRNGECHRSVNAYAHVLAGDLDFAGGGDFVACSGAKTKHVLETGQDGEPPQIDAIGPDASLVTIGIGGNDAKWTEELLSCWASSAEGQCIEDRAGADEQLDKAATKAGKVYAEARKRAPDARIVAVGYPRFFPTDPVDDQYVVKAGGCRVALCSVKIRRSMSVEEQRYLNEQTRKFNERLAEEAEAAGVEFVDLTDTFDGHEIGTSDSYFNGFQPRLPSFPLDVDDLDDLRDQMIHAESLHPTAAGQAAMAEAVRAQVEHPE